MPVVENTLSPCPVPKAAISGKTLVKDFYSSMAGITPAGPISAPNKVRTCSHILFMDGHSTLLKKDRGWALFETPLLVLLRNRVGQTVQGFKI